MVSADSSSGKRREDYDLFLSYSSFDRDAVSGIRSHLETLGVSTFLDRANLTAGQPWPKELEEALASCRGVAVFVGNRPEFGMWQLRESWMALDRQAQAQQRGESFPVVPVLLSGADPRAGFLFLNTWVDLRGGVDDSQGIDALVQALRTPAEEARRQIPDICPYRGLEPFRSQDEPFFFGRDAFTEQLLEKVLSHDLVAVVGPSGSGKSSVVQAGLLPALGRHREGRAWEVVTLRPGTEPFRALGRALLPLLEPELGERARLAEGNALGDDLRSGTVGIEETAERLLDKSNGSTRLLLIVDQFEELFREAPEEHRVPFVAALLKGLERASVGVIVTLRADFYGQALDLSRALADRLAAGQTNIGPLTSEEVERVVSGPAERVDLAFESGLVDDILRDAGDDRGRLPLLEFCLQELWNERLGGTLTHEGYQTIGRVTGALAKRADRALASLEPRQRTVAQRLFTGRLVRLADPSEGGSDTKSQALLAELDPLEEQVIEAFSGKRSRLLYASESSVELAHEELIRSWDTLRGWLEGDREFRLWQQRARYSLEGRRFVMGRTLRELAHWRRRRPDLISTSERRLIERSLWLKRAAAAAGVAALLAVVWLSALEPWRRNARGRLQKEIAGASVEELPDMLESRWPIAGTDVADALRAVGRFDEAIETDWEFDFLEEPERLFTLTQPRLEVLASEGEPSEEPYKNFSEALWRLDYLSVQAERENHRQRAAGLGRELRKLLRRAVKERLGNDPPTTAAKFRLIQPEERDLECGNSPASFCMGSLERPNEQPVHPVKLSPYCIQVREVTKGDYESFRSSPVVSGLPKVEVTWWEAYAYAAWLGGRLPTEAQWEFAARGSEAREYPWGEEGPTCERANFRSCGSGVKAVGTHPEGATPEGVEDLAGNVWEWVADWDGSYTEELQKDPWGIAAAPGLRVIRGGSFNHFQVFVRSAVRSWNDSGNRDATVGFRVVLPAPCRGSALERR